MMKPRIAIVNNNTLEAMGLKNIIDEIIPMADVKVYHTLKELTEEDTTQFYHFFVSTRCLFEASNFFLQNRRKTVVLVEREDTSINLGHYHTLCTTQPEHQLIKSILRLHQTGHGHPANPGANHSDVLSEESTFHPLDISPRECEVLALVARGFINKEIADRLNISLPTVITHRKNICEKLHLHSVSSLTIYAVTHGIVRVEDI